jgi:hypothetical protein
MICHLWEHVVFPSWCNLASQEFKMKHVGTINRLSRCANAFTLGSAVL